MNELEIFSAALEIEEKTARSHYVNQACAGDAQLRDRINELLSSASKRDSFMERSPRQPKRVLESCALPETKDDADSEALGSTIGRFKLLQKLGEGGMGSVFMAEQKHPVRRRVALKIVKQGMDCKAIVRRFEAERQALSMMDHPNIARALDAGTTENGRPYFVMELVKGIPITKYCDNHKLTIRERLALLIPICHAVQHAHQKGIVHRDIKPSNLLVAEYDEQAVPKVIDFGVAKALHQPLTEKTLFTQVGQIIGTLDYMSPEQAKVNELDVDTRSDVYSLGVVLYELLTGSTPHSGKRLRSAGLAELIRIIRDEDPPTPSKRLSSTQTLEQVAETRGVSPKRIGLVIRGELDWIVMKALDKDRNRRYQSCGELADDVRRFLDQEQVLACPPTLEYRISKFVRRNTVGVAATTAVVLALLFGLVTTTWQWWQTQILYQDLSETYTQMKSVRRNTNSNEAAFTSLFDRDERMHGELVRTFDEVFRSIENTSDASQPGPHPILDDAALAVLKYWDVAIEESRFAGKDGPDTNYFRLRRAFTLARWGKHAEAIAETRAIIPYREWEWVPEGEVEIRIRIFGLCARAVTEDSAMFRVYVDEGFKLIKQQVLDAHEELKRIDRQRARGIHEHDKMMVIAAVRDLLNSPDIEPIRSRMNEIQDATALFMNSNIEIDPKAFEESNRSRVSITGFPYPQRDERK